MAKATGFALWPSWLRGQAKPRRAEGAVVAAKRSSNPAPATGWPLEKERPSTWKRPLGVAKRPLWLRGQDLDLRPLGYEHPRHS